MATNTFAPFGFSQYRGQGSAPTYELVTTWCNYNTAAMYAGDPVYRNSGGFIFPNTPGTGTLAGVFAGCKYLSVAQGRTVWRNYWGAADIASTNTVECQIVNDPNALFVAQVGATGANNPMTTASIGMNVQFAYGTPNTLSGVSGAYVDGSVAPATTNTLPFRLVNVVTDPPGANGTATGSAFNWVIVGFNNVETRQLTGV